MKPFFVFDLDGTLADVSHREHYLKGEKKDWAGFFEACDGDAPIHAVIAALHAHQWAKHRVEIWSGRSDAVRRKTRDWLYAHDINPDLLTNMRREGDYTVDHELKLAWLKSCDPKPTAVYDDRPTVVAMWRANGIPCFQVESDERWK